MVKKALYIDGEEIRYSVSDTDNVTIWMPDGTKMFVRATEMMSFLCVRGCNNWTIEKLKDDRKNNRSPMVCEAMVRDYILKRRKYA